MESMSALGNAAFGVLVMLCVGVACDSESDERRSDDGPHEMSSGPGQTDSSYADSTSPDPVEGERHPSCDDESDCEGGLTCVLSVCRAVPIECGDTGDCPEGYACALEGLKEVCPDCENDFGCVLQGVCKEVTGTSCGVNESGTSGQAVFDGGAKTGGPSSESGGAEPD